MDSISFLCLMHGGSLCNLSASISSIRIYVHLCLRMSAVHAKNKQISELKQMPTVGVSHGSLIFKTSI